MRRAMCTCHPTSCGAGEVGTFQFVYTPPANLPKGAKLRFDLATQGRYSLDWETPQTNLKEKKNLIWATLPDGKVVGAKTVELPSKKEAHPSSLYEFVLPIEIKGGESFTIFVGTPLKKADSGTRAQLNVQRRRPFYLSIDPRGKNEFKEQEIFHLDVRGSALHNIRILTPSIIGKNKRFDILVRFEDAYGNLTNDAPEGSLIELSYENQRENLNWKLFVPETGFINLPNLYFNEVGVYKIQLLNLKTGDTYYSSPIKCLSETAVTLCWGVFHGESEKTDSQENIESCLRQFRDEKVVQFYGVSPSESGEETSPESWKLISTQVAEFNEDQRFSTFLGFQYFTEEEGVRQIVYLKDQKPLLRQKEAKSSTLSRIYKLLNSKEAFSIPQMTMATGLEDDFSHFDPEMEKVVEIYNAWGSSECTAKEGNLRPIKSSSKGGIQETEAGSILKALKNNHRFGFVAGGLDDRGVYKKLRQEKQSQYSPGLTAILSTDLARDAIATAIQNRSCYATTGERIIVGLYIAGLPMGKELSTKIKPGLALNRYITGYVAGTAPLKEVALIRNGSLIKNFATKSYFVDFTYDDMENLSKITLPGGALASGEKRPPFVFYYLRVTQADGHIAWSSPIWIDHPELEENPLTKKAPLKKSSSQTAHRSKK